MKSIPPLCFASLLLSASVCVSLSAAVTNTDYPPHTFTLPDGYELELVAPPPLVERPMHMYFDEDGSLYVTDSSGDSQKAPLQLSNPSHRILRLVDTDGDGLFDESTVFADKVPFPEGILVYEGDVYVGAPPHIWKFSDTDGDHVSDERTSWFNGGTIEGCGNDMHGPYLGPDGYFYWTKGFYLEQNFVLGDGKLHRSKAAHAFRARPDGTELEVVMTGGMNNPVGLAFGETGERFLSGTFFVHPATHPGQRDGILHAVYGGVYGRKNPAVLSGHPRTGDFLPIMSHLGPSASSGVMMPRNGTSGLRGDLLCADFNLGSVSRHKLSRSGSSFSSEIDVLLQSDQSDYHPTDVIEDADGSILVADTGNWYTMCCPTSSDANEESLGAIYRIRKTGAKRHEDPRGFELDWENPSIAYLSDERPVVVSRAIEALASVEQIDALKAAQARVPALWSLHRIEGAAAREAVRERINNGSPEERSVAIRSAGLWRDPEAVAALSEALRSEDTHIRRIAAMALGRIGDPSSTDALLEAGKGELDPFLKHSITYALFEVGAGESVSESHPLGKQLQSMEEVARSGPNPNVRPDITPADPPEIDPAQVTHQFKRMGELRSHFAKHRGDPERGEKIFADASKLCIVCHRLGDQGVDYGPDLTHIGAIRGKWDILEAIVFPGTSIVRYYEKVDVRTKEGAFSGLIIDETENSMTLAAWPGAEVTIRTEDIIEAKYSSASLMPSFDGILSPEELADLVAYLQKAK
ncbi:PVC-type heme-binding CxxCH protein [Pelagicoccus mobilis]|uniref:HEAT repeat domain-containing protein n=1 Tax=Pelagicoccus mobilis TaxID=415221 RepID=A0A934VR12_9BACT|nr:PVC-type heme-binding CxxCH protein [Pelagicoccus mobilis]MBK1877460.1 HEAT repeat domain-containing protein [Pelagicoccus mobilis]